jgi:hypothetical protein
MEQKEIKDADIEPIAEEQSFNGESLAKKKKREMIFELALFFVLGVLLGITIKTEAIKRVTIGFNDYQIASPAQKYDIENIKKDIEAKAATAQQQAMQQQEASQQGGAENSQGVTEETGEQQ